MGAVNILFAESDLVPLVKRYTSSTIVTLLREIAKCNSVKIDWGLLCKSTATGISNPKEYQALWRSIAYRAELEDSFDDNDAPLEDDSDIEVDLDPVPSVTPTVVDSISSFVKADLQQNEIEEVLSEQNVGQAGVELQAGDIGTANRQQLRPSSTFPCAAAYGESTPSLSCSTNTKSVYSGALNQSDRKRRRLWTPEEDLELIAAVEKCGEGNWTTVLKSHYNFDRSASQLSQRWALIRKRREVQEKSGYSGATSLTSGVAEGQHKGSGPQLTSPNDTGKLGDNRLSPANVPMPIKQPPSSATSASLSKKVTVACSAMSSEPPSSTVLETQRLRTQPVSGVSSSWASVPGQRLPANNHPSIRGNVTTSGGASSAAQAQKGATSEGVAGGPHVHGSGVRRAAQAPAGSQIRHTNSQSVTTTVAVDSKYAAPRNMGVGVARGGSKGLHGPDPMVQAAAMAAGARIAPASTAASLLMAAQSGNVVHIGSGGLPRSKLGLSNQSGSGNTGSSPGAIVHYIRTGSGGASLATPANVAGLQRPPSHHVIKSQSNRGLGSNSGTYSAGNASPSSTSAVLPQTARNNAQSQSAAVQSSKSAPTFKRGSSPQQKASPASSPACGFCTAEPVADVNGEGTS